MAYGNEMTIINNERSQLGFEGKHPILSRAVLELVASVGEGLRNPDRWIGTVAQDNADRRMQKNIARAIMQGCNVEYTNGDVVFKTTNNY